MKLGGTVNMEIIWKILSGQKYLCDWWRLRSACAFQSDQSSLFAWALRAYGLFKIVLQEYTFTRINCGSVWGVRETSKFGVKSFFGSFTWAIQYLPKLGRYKNVTWENIRFWSICRQVYMLLQYTFTCTVDILETSQYIALKIIWQWHHVSNHSTKVKKIFAWMIGETLQFFLCRTDCKHMEIIQTKSLTRLTDLCLVFFFF